MLLQRSGESVRCVYEGRLGVDTSSEFFCRMAARPESPSVGAMLLFEPARWPETCVRRFCAGIHGQSYLLP
jgi:hypothetical protein